MIVECGHCGAPLDVRENARVTRCRYCGVSNERQKLRTIAAETPPDFRPPKVWHPPAHVAADSNVELKYKKGGSPGCVVVVLLLVLVGAGFGIYKVGRRAAFSPHDLVGITLDGTYKEFCKKQVAAAEMENWCIIYFRTQGYDFVNVTWEPKFPDHAAGFTVAITRGAHNDFTKKRFAEVIPGGLDEHGAWRMPGMQVNVQDDGSMSVNAKPELNPSWKKQVDLLFRVFLYSAFNAGAPPTKAELNEVLGAGYPLKDLLKLDTDTTVDKAAAAVRAIFPQAQVEDSRVEIHVGVDHPLFSQVELKWRNERGKGLEGASFKATSAYAAGRRNLVSCLSKRLGVQAVARETDYLKKKEDYHFVIGKMWFYLPESYAYTGSDLDAASWKALVTALDACRS